MSHLRPGSPKTSKGFIWSIHQPQLIDLGESIPLDTDDFPYDAAASDEMQDERGPSNPLYTDDFLYDATFLDWMRDECRLSNC